MTRRSLFFNAEVVDSLRQIVEAVERYIKNESTRLVTVLEKLGAKVPEFIVIKKLRARLDEMREDKATHLTLDKVFDSLQRPLVSSAHVY
jgi:hypothetical protein